MSDQIQLRLEEVLLLLPCPIAGCWGTHGAKTAYYYDKGSESHVLEVWPNTFLATDENDEHADEQPDGETHFALAEFDFMGLVETVPLAKFHFSQPRAIFEIGWKELGKLLELWIHLEPEELD